MKQPLIIIAGPTASGKTAAAVALAQKINGEIISADSMQVYKTMDIGTAKPTKEEMGDVRHYLIDEVPPDADFSVADFQRLAKQYIAEIASAGKIPIVTGGTGFYINALLYDNYFMETNKENGDETIRTELRNLAEEQGREHLHRLLREVDPEAAERIHPHNVKRVVRAIEYYRQTGQKISEHNRQARERESPYNAALFILNRERSCLYQRINDRVDLMIDKGLVQEVKTLLAMGYSESLKSMQGLGYKEIVQYLNGTIKWDEAVFLIKQNTRHYAKRQITWFKNQNSGLWLDVDENGNNSIIEDKIVQHTAHCINCGQRKGR